MSRSAAGPRTWQSVFERAPDATVLVDARGRIVEANAQTERLFGYSRGELLGSSVELLLPERFAANHAAQRRDYAASPHTRPMGEGSDLIARRKDGSEVPVNIMLSPLDGDALVVAVLRDVTERKQAEEQARQLRETYLKELHHRIKNNFQVVASLLFLQSRHTTDPGALEALRESQIRVQSVSLIHETLYRSSSLTEIDFPAYVRDLIEGLLRAYGVDRDALTVHTEISDVDLQLDTAIPCGLIVNELVSNALKHAFPGGRQGTLRVALAPAGEGRFTLVVRDDGVGLPEGYAEKTEDSLGLSLVRELTRQLDGQVEVEPSPGTTFRITFQQARFKAR